MRWLVLAAVLVVGCGDIYPRPVIVVDQSVPMEAAVAAIRAWSVVAVPVEIATEGVGNLLITAGAETDCETQPDGVLYVGAYRPTDRDVIYIRMACYQDSSPAATIAHEMGHWYGIGHVGPEPGIMNAPFNEGPAPVISEADIAAFRAVWGR